ncbi:hypothetical protein MNBD_GAMMA05-936, partial [hydrothermal vent metagenome]
TVQLVESVREQGKVKQRIIKHLGVAYDQKQLDDLKALAQGLGVKPILRCNEIVLEYSL